MSMINLKLLQSDVNPVEEMVIAKSKLKRVVYQLIAPVDARHTVIRIEIRLIVRSNVSYTVTWQIMINSLWSVGYLHTDTHINELL